MQNRATSFGGASGSVVVEAGPAGTADRRVMPREISKGEVGGCHTSWIPADWPALCGFVESG